MIKQDKLGCYRVGNLKFYSKLDAIEMHGKTGIHPHWDFNEEVFSSYNWTKEPEISLPELYRQRAQQIRDQYDYVILMYSGGADSHNILDTFINNDIKIDEIATFMGYKSTGNKESWFNAEVFKVAAPYVTTIQEQYPYLNFRILDATDWIIDYFSNADLTPNWIYSMNMFFGPNNVARQNLPFKIKEWSDIIYSGKKLCVLWGSEKPRLIHQNNKFAFRFIDLIDSAATVKSIAGEHPYTDELFYWTPDLPALIIKQAHLIMNFLKSPMMQHSPFVTTTPTALAYIERNNQQYWLNIHGIHQIIYPTWNVDTFTTGKNPSIIYPYRDQWFLQLGNENQMKYIWNQGITKLWEIVPDYWKADTDNISQGLKACYSKNYFLEEN